MDVAARRHRPPVLAGAVLVALAVVAMGLARPGAARAAGTAIVVAGQPVEVGRPVVLWSDPEGFDGYARTCLEARAIDTSPCCRRQFRRYSARKGLTARTLEGLRAQLRQVVLHLDGCVNSRSCFHSMHDMPRPDGRCGLSAHFMVDADGTIYQTLDLVENAWHAEQSNAVSVGIELCNRGDASRDELDRLPPDYRTRPVKEVVINGRGYQAFDFRPEQYQSVLALTRVLVRLFPLIRPLYPERDGKPLLETLADPLRFAGIVGHLHVDREQRKWDPGAFDWVRLKRVLRGFHFPIAVRGYADVPEEPEALRRAAFAFFRNAEERASGHYPLAPSGLWHSGVHLRGIAGEPVHAPARGRLLAARVGENAGSSTSLVLLRHDLELGAERLTFYTLLAHLARERVSAESSVPWIRELVRRGDQAATTALERGQVALLDLPVEAGDVVGSIGWVRRGPEIGPEVHVETFTAERPPEVVSRGFRLIGAAADGLFVTHGGLVRLVDEDGNGRITATELRRFFREGNPTQHQTLRHLEIRHVHEWGDRLADPAKAAPGLRGPGAAAQVRALRARIIDPYVFWTDRLSAHAGLPASQTIHSFHPIAFLATIAAAARNTPLRWPSRAPLGTDDAAPAVVAADDWIAPREAHDESRPIFGPVVGAVTRIPRRSDIPLIVLP